MTDEIQVRTICRACGGKGLLCTGEVLSIGGWKFFRHAPCAACQGSGKEIRWIDIYDLARLLEAIAAETQKA